MKIFVVAFGCSCLRTDVVMVTVKMAMDIRFKSLLSRPSLKCMLRCQKGYKKALAGFISEIFSIPSTIFTRRKRPFYVPVYARVLSRMALVYRNILKYRILKYFPSSDTTRTSTCFLQFFAYFQKKRKKIG